MNKKDNNMIACNDLEFVSREIWARINKKRILKYLRSMDTPETDEMLRNLISKGISVFPFNFTSNYNLKNVLINKRDGFWCWDDGEGNNIFLKKKYKSKYRAQRYINNILTEQDGASPHKYVSDNFRPDEDSIIIDIGGAEGYFAYKFVESVKAIYIFECDDDWIEVLNKTFEPWNDKVFIIKKFVSDCDDNNNISIDSFVKTYGLEKEKLFIKVDAEGNEIKVLDGARIVIESNQDIKLSICTYHKHNHESKIKNLLKGWQFENTPGFMLFYYDYEIAEPYIRRGVLRCYR